LNDFRVWQFQIESFAQKFHVVSYSRRYAYPNQWPGDGEDNNVTNNAADLAELIIKRVDLGPAHLIGHSYGALTALYMAYPHPELVRTLVLGEPPVMSSSSKITADIAKMSMRLERMYKTLSEEVIWKER
jgi:non-heme chloroperoxidase